MISVVLPKISQPSRETEKRYDECFVKAKCASIIDGTTIIAIFLVTVNY